MKTYEPEVEVIARSEADSQRQGRLEAYRNMLQDAVVTREEEDNGRKGIH